MKKILTLSAMAVFALAGCNMEAPQNQESSAALNSSQNEITFSNYFGRAITKGDNLNGNINVYCLDHSTLNNIEFKYSNGSYVPNTDGDHYYWEKSTHTFCAVKPAEIQLTASGAFEESYTPSNDVDLITAKAVDVEYDNVPATGVPLEFRHSLSQVKFTALVSPSFASEIPDNNIVRVSELKINQIHTTGQCTIDETADNWSFSGIKSDLFYVTSTNPVEIESDPTQDPTDLSTKSIIPQSNDDGLTFSVTIQLYNQTTQKVTAERKLECKFKIESESAPLRSLAAGTKYTCKLVIEMKEITFNVSAATDWEDGGQISYDWE